MFSSLLWLFWAFHWDQDHGCGTFANCSPSQSHLGIHYRHKRGIQPLPTGSWGLTSFRKALVSSLWLLGPHEPQFGHQKCGSVSCQDAEVEQWLWGPEGTSWKNVMLAQFLSREMRAEVNTAVLGSGSVMPPLSEANCCLPNFTFLS